ncbi:hypothetical protein HOY80DRAFT_1098101 [Tuber brumale]|nr:hypothetical protein HOY80DRAFT_1098101 [Tuber brumale]
MSLNRSLLRNVSFYNATHPGTALGGLFQNGSLTEGNFVDILEMLLVVEGCPLRVLERISGHIISRTDLPIKTGCYDIYSDASIHVSNEPWLPRLIAHDTSGRDDSFRRGIYNRDRRYYIFSGLVNPEIRIQANNWTSFQVAHIFPREHESLWIRGGNDRWIADAEDTGGSSKIKSCQNGFLLQSGVHQKFNQYLVSVNPDDNFKIVVFDMDIRRLDGRTLDPICRDPADPHSVSDELLRWHFHQSVLANVRGAGEPIFEHDFPSGTDMVGQERFELEIAARLSGVF